MDCLENINEKGIYCIDLHFMGIPGRIAAYLIRHDNGGILVECGPGSTIPSLEAGFLAHGLHVSDITDVFLTHIHLDHAGAAGWLARQGANIYVHPHGLPHMLDPEKLLSSASRLYGNLMDTLWGEFLPVPANKIFPLYDSNITKIGRRKILALETPGHADHHLVLIVDGVCFSGDIGGVRLQGSRYIRLPTPPPEFNLEKWRQSINRLSESDFDYIAPTHFGFFLDRDRHLETVRSNLDSLEKWIEVTLPSGPDLDSLNSKYSDWTLVELNKEGDGPDQAQAYETVGPSWMCVSGIERYWRKYRVEANSDS